MSNPTSYVHPLDHPVAKLEKQQQNLAARSRNTRLVRMGFNIGGAALALFLFTGLITAIIGTAIAAAIVVTHWAINSGKPLPEYAKNYRDAYKKILLAPACQEWASPLEYRMEQGFSYSEFARNNYGGWVGDNNASSYLSFGRFSYYDKKDVRTLIDLVEMGWKNGATFKGLSVQQDFNAPIEGKIIIVLQKQQPNTAYRKNFQKMDISHPLFEVYATHPDSAKSFVTNELLQKIQACFLANRGYVCITAEHLFMVLDTPKEIFQQHLFNDQLYAPAFLQNLQTDFSMIKKVLENVRAVVA